MGILIQTRQIELCGWWKVHLLFLIVFNLPHPPFPMVPASLKSLFLLTLFALTLMILLRFSFLSRLINDYLFEFFFLLSWISEIFSFFYLGFFLYWILILGFWCFYCIVILQNGVEIELGKSYKWAMANEIGLCSFLGNYLNVFFVCQWKHGYRLYFSTTLELVYFNSDFSLWILSFLHEVLHY